MRAFVFLMWLSCAGLMMAGSDVADFEDALEEAIENSRWQDRRLEVRWSVDAPEVEEGGALRVAPASLAGKRVVFDFSKAEVRLKPRKAPDDGWSVWAPVEDSFRKDVVVFDGGDRLDVWRRLRDGQKVAEWHMHYSPDDDGKSGVVWWGMEMAPAGGSMDERHLVFESPDSGYVLPYPDCYAWDFSREIRGVRFTLVDAGEQIRKMGEVCREEQQDVSVHVSFDDARYDWLMKPWNDKVATEEMIVSQEDKQSLKRLMAGMRSGPCGSSELADVPFWVIHVGNNVSLSSLEWALGMVGFASDEEEAEFGKLMARLVKNPVGRYGDRGRR